MSIWQSLFKWAEQRRSPLIVTLLNAPPGPEWAMRRRSGEVTASLDPEKGGQCPTTFQDGLAGRLAAAESPASPFEGPLTLAPFWAADWPLMAERLAAGPLPASGLLWETQGRRYLLATIQYKRSALVLGGGHVGGALSRLLRFLDFEVTILDDRPEFLKNPAEGVRAVAAPFSRVSALFENSGFEALVIVTRGHAQDSDCLRQALAWASPPPYLGMIGSRRRTAAALAMLKDEGYSPERLARVHTPIGLNIGAQTPAEIAVSIAAQIIQVLNQPSSFKESGPTHLKAE